MITSKRVKDLNGIEEQSLYLLSQTLNEILFKKENIEPTFSIFTYQWVLPIGNGKEGKYWKFKKYQTGEQYQKSKKQQEYNAFS